MTAPDIQEMDRTRERFGDMMEELAAKADMKARARDKAADVKVMAQDRATEFSGLVRRSSVMQRRWPLAVAAGVLVVGSVALRRRRRK